MTEVFDAELATGKHAPYHGKSIDLWHSFNDWRNTSSALQLPTEDCIKTNAFASARAKSLQIEQNLFKEIFSPNVYLVPLDQSAFGEKEATESDLVARFIDTELPSSAVPGALYIHELEIRNTKDLSVPRKDIVVIHGYMAASGFFLKNVEQLAASYPNSVVHVIDLPGFGNSARPKFPKKLLKSAPKATTLREINQILAAEDWFIDKLEEWRLQKGIEHFDLIAHSMGAYISSCYLMKYNKKINGSLIVDKFALVSPLGTEPSEVSFISGEKFRFDHSEVKSNPLREILASQDFENGGVNEDFIQLWETLGKPRFPSSKLLKTLWDNNISPFLVLQWFGPFYSKILSLWSFQRFRDVHSNSEGEHSDNSDLILKLHDYSFSIFNQYQASGELAITKFINHEILPRLPLSDRGFVEFLDTNGIKTLWLYGENDWMNTKGGQFCVEKIKKLGSVEANLQEIKNAGHHLYLDNPSAFNGAIEKFFGYGEIGH